MQPWSQFPTAEKAYHLIVRLLTSNLQLKMLIKILAPENTVELPLLCEPFRVSQIQT